MRVRYRRWSEHPYPGEPFPPIGSSNPAYWPMFFIRRGSGNQFLDPFGQPIKWRIKNPNEIHWERELLFVEQVLYSINEQQRRLAYYWGTIEVIERINPLIYSLIKRYRVGSPHAARILAYFHAAMNDTFIITWYLKYLWDVARPNQYNRQLPTVLNTPRFPSYPSAHAALAGCADVILSYFFPSERLRITRIMEFAAESRLYAGVHFKIDNDEGLRIGRHLGEIVVNLIRTQNLRL